MVTDNISDDELDSEDSNREDHDYHEYPDEEKIEEDVDGGNYGEPYYNFNIPNKNKCAFSSLNETNYKL